uniref:Uncharacterized protein n=1 Tax=Romanomermis culicivorax TaxID=13658 RepID=A0A915L4V7_ROMCU
MHCLHQCKMGAKPKVYKIYERNEKINVGQSGTYKAVHQNGQLAPQHSARYDEPREYPQYKGYVDPNIQSPSFKRLQQYTGLDQSSEEAPPGNCKFLKPPEFAVSPEV